VDRPRITYALAHGAADALDEVDVPRRREEGLDGKGRAVVRARRVAVAHGLGTIAFPAISCGIYGYPLELAAPLAVQTCATFVAAEPRIERVVFALFADDALRAYEAALARRA